MHEYKNIIKSWQWRIKKAGLDQNAFCESIGIKAQMFSPWVTGRVEPTLCNFFKVEEKLKELGV